MENPYARAPLQVTLYDVSAGGPARSYMLLGAIPKSVLAAARRGAAPRETKRPEVRWEKADAATLQRHYGPRWRWLLTPRVGDAAAAADDEDERVGGGEPEDFYGRRGRESVDFGNLDDFDDIDIVIDEEDLDSSPEALTSLPPLTGEAEAPPPARGTQTVYTELGAFPEDTFADLKQKIYAATQIPPYRQHLFYGHTQEEDELAPESGTGGRPVRTTYRITVEGALVPVDVRRLARELRSLAETGGAPGQQNVVAGVPVDARLEEQKEDVRVDALDSFRTLEEGPGALVRRVFVADLATLVAPRAAAVAGALGDRYQFDLLYYGAILKFWPELSADAFRLAVTRPAEIPAAYPLLEPPLEKVRARLRLEQALIERTYAQSKAEAARAARAEKQKGVAVTEASVTVDPPAAKTPVNLRNILDWVPATRAVPAIVGRIPPEMVGREAGAEGRGRKDYIVEKRHVSAAAARVAASLGRFFDHPPKRPGVAYAVVGETEKRRERREGEAPRFVFLTVFDDGRYTVESSWREDDRIGFDEVVRQLSAAARPIIDAINQMGAAALPLGGRLETPAEAARAGGGRAEIGALTVSAFWPHALTSEGFRELKSRWREYERAGIVGIRGLQQAGAYAFFFRKGITNYDPRAMERVVARGGLGPGGRQVITNHYAHLTDPALAQRWQYYYAGRPVRVFHRTTDLRVEVAGVDLREFERIRLYIFVFLDGLVYGPDRLARGVVRPGQTRLAEGRLKGLQERDPDLFDLKKFDEGATVYSVLCQGARQPEMLTEEEARQAKQKNLVKYWNFTEGRPAYYRCPTRTFPHLSFRMGEHPLGNCLPCCKKTRPLPGSRAETVNRLCLQKHRLLEEDEAAAGEDPLAVSRHVLIYGKPVPVGRISQAPRLVSDGLFYDTLPAPFAYRLVGVEQHLPALPDAGFFFALAAAVGVEPDDFARELAETAEALSETFYSLADGGAAVFPTAAGLAGELLATFLPPPGAAGFSPFGPGGAAAAVWRQLLADLVRVRFDIETVVFADAAGDGDVALEASAGAAARIRASDRIPADVAVLVSEPSGTYPLAAMDEKAFMRHSYGRGPARRFFSTEYGGDDVEDRVVGVLRDMIGAHRAARAPPCPPGGQTLDFVLALAKKQNYRVLYRLVNLRDMCYGVVLVPDESRPDEWAYFPVPYSPHFLPPRGAGAAPAAYYGPRPEGRYPAAALAAVLAEANRRLASAKTAGKAAPCPPIAFGARLVDTAAQTVGFIAEGRAGGLPSGQPGGLYFHHDPVGDAGGLPWGGRPEARVPYPFAELDRAIYEAGGVPERPPLPAAKVPLARAGLYRHYLYRLFVAEFAALLQDERDAEKRQALQALFRETRFNSPTSLAKFRETLRQVLADHPEDATAVRGLVVAAYARAGPAQMKTALAEAFDTAVFGFDRATLNRLRALGAEDPARLRGELGRLMEGQVELEGAARPAAPEGAEPAGIQNMYVACSLPTTVGRPQCIRRRLRMPADRFEPYVAILAADVLNPLKAATFAALTAGVVEGTRFVTRPGERIILR